MLELCLAVMLTVEAFLLGVSLERAGEISMVGEEIAVTAFLIGVTAVMAFVLDKMSQME